MEVYEEYDTYRLIQAEACILLELDQELSQFALTRSEGVVLMQELAMCNLFRQH